MVQMKRFRPRRGKESTLKNKNPILLSGELIVEVPEVGVGKGKVRMKMGDGTTPYKDLPYAVESDPSDEVITFTTSTNTDTTTLLNEIVSGKTLSKLLGSIKGLISKLDEKMNTRYSLEGGVQIPSNANLNDYLSIGNYFCSSDIEAASLLNSPTKSAFIMKVYYGIGINGYINQEIKDLYNTGVWRRWWHIDGGWRPWGKMQELIKPVGTNGIVLSEFASIHNLMAIDQVSICKTGNIVYFYIGFHFTSDLSGAHIIAFTLKQGYTPFFTVDNLKLNLYTHTYPYNEYDRANAFIGAGMIEFYGSFSAGEELIISGSYPLA